ncbi:hypothetical protein [Streptomyces sp. SD15]
MATAVAARAYALNHQDDQARDALAAADALMERLPEGERSDTWLTYSEQKHHVHLSHAYTTLGDTRRAHESQQRALELPAPTSTMTRTLLHIDSATCSHHDGDSEEACRRTVTALAALPDGYRTGLVRRRYWCEVEDREVSYGEMGRGYELSLGVRAVAVPLFSR